MANVSVSLVKNNFTATLVAAPSFSVVNNDQVVNITNTSTSITINHPLSTIDIVTEGIMSVLAASTGTTNIFAANGTQKLFQLSTEIIAQEFVEVSVGGVVQEPGSSYSTYTLNTATTSATSFVNFVDAPPSGVDVLVRFYSILAGIALQGFTGPVGPKGDTGPVGPASTWDNLTNRAKANGPTSINVGLYAGAADTVGLPSAITDAPMSYGAIAIGPMAGNIAPLEGYDGVTQGFADIKIGNQAGAGGSIAYSIGIGYQAGGGALDYSGPVYQAQGEYSIGIGFQSGGLNQGASSTAVGQNAGTSYQSSYASAFGSQAGSISQGQYAVAIGRYAGNYHQGADSVAIGHRAATGTQATFAVALGSYAAEKNQSDYTVAVGASAGQYSQQVNSVAIGKQAGQINLGPDSVAIGPYAQNTATQGYNVAVGRYAGNTGQGSRATALGSRAGQTNQGNFSVAIGGAAGQNSQADNSIVINAQGALPAGSVALDAPASGFYVKPIRHPGGSIPSGFHPMYYNPTTGEIIVVY